MWVQCMVDPENNLETLVAKDTVSAPSLIANMCDLLKKCPPPTTSLNPPCVLCLCAGGGTCSTIIMANEDFQCKCSKVAMYATDGKIHC